MTRPGAVADWYWVDRYYLIGVYRRGYRSRRYMIRNNMLSRCSNKSEALEAISYYLYYPWPP